MCLCSFFHFPLVLLPSAPADPAGTLCNPDLDPPEGSIRKPLCEVNPFLPHHSTLKWVAPLTDSSTSPLYLQADWLSSMHQGLNKQLTVAAVMRAPTASKEHSGTVSPHPRPVGKKVYLVCVEIDFTYLSFHSNLEREQQNAARAVQTRRASLTGLRLLG